MEPKNPFENPHVTKVDNEDSEFTDSMENLGRVLHENSKNREKLEDHNGYEIFSEQKEDGSREITLQKGGFSSVFTIFIDKEVQPPTLHGSSDDLPFTKKMMQEHQEEFNILFTSLQHPQYQSTQSTEDLLQDMKDTAAERGDN